MARPKTQKMTGLWRVKAGRVLRWPDAIMTQENHPLNQRGKGGYVVDMDQPYEAALSYGMAKFLEPVPESEQAAARERLDDPSHWPRPIVNFLADRGLLKRTPPRRKTLEAKLKGNAQSQALTPPDLIPDIDEAPAKRKPKSEPTPPTQGKFTEGADI